MYNILYRNYIYFFIWKQIRYISTKVLEEKVVTIPELSIPIPDTFGEFAKMCNFGKFPLIEAKHLRLCYNITCNSLPQYLWQGLHPNRMLQEIL